VFSLDSFLFSLNATMPVFLVILLGYVLMKIGFFTKAFTDVADRYVFQVALPVLLFYDIATTDLRQNFQLKFVLFCVVVTTIMFWGVYLLARIFLKDKSMVGAFAQAAARGSAAILGIAFVENIYGDPGLTPLMIVAAVPLFNVYSVLILTFSAPGSSGKGQLKRACINVAKNPIILGILAGIPFSLLQIQLPTILTKTITSVGGTATPIALLVVGAGFQTGAALSKWKPALWATAIKLVFLPMIFLPVAVWMGFTGSELIAILVMVGSPTTVTCYIMAKNMGNDGVLSSSVVVLATLLSSVTLTFWIFLLRVLQLI
jgi:hypothetical protein